MTILDFVKTRLIVESEDDYLIDASSELMDEDSMQDWAETFLYPLLPGFWTFLAVLRRTRQEDDPKRHDERRRPVANGWEYPVGPKIRQTGQDPPQVSSRLLLLLLRL